MKTRRILIPAFIIVFSLGILDCQGDPINRTQTPELKPTAKSSATETQSDQPYPYPAPTLTLNKVTLERSAISLDPTSARTTPIPTPQRTPLPIRELSISRQVFPLSSEPLPVDAIWFSLGDQVMALTSEQETYPSEYPGYVRASPDGTKISYTDSRNLVVYNFSVSEQWEYSYDSNRSENDTFFTQPVYSPDGDQLTFTALGNGWGIKKIDLVSGNVDDIPIPEDFWQTTGELPESTSMPHLASLVQPGGIRQYAFFPIAWTDLGIYGIMVLPGTDAGHSGFWLADPENGDIKVVIDTGQTMAPRHGGESVAVLDANTFPPVEPFTSTITLWNIQSGSQEILYQDFQNTVHMGTWSPQEDKIHLYLRQDWSQTDTPVIRIISEAGIIENDFNFTYLHEGERLTGIDWLDNDTLIFMISDSEKRIAELYSLPVLSEGIEERQLIANIPVENPDGWHGILYIPAL